MEASTQRLAQELATVRPSRFHVVALPDFFLDHLVAAPPWDEALRAMREVHERGGGNVHGWPQRLQPGGNAANAALALARLGVHSHLVARTDSFGLAYLRETVGHHGVDLRQVRADGELAVTTALEFGPARRNVMLSYPGSVANFRLEDLDENQQTLIQGSDAVLAANWGANREAGTSLLEGVLKLAAGGTALSYVDTGDPSSRAGEIPDLLRRVVRSGDLDVLAMNENELRLLSGSDLPLEGLRSLASRATATLDVHTSRFSASSGPRGEAQSPCFHVGLRRATGAGDVWNAGNLLGHLLDFEPAARLALANAVAALYVSSSDPLPPRMGDVVEFLKTGPALQS